MVRSLVDFKEDESLLGELYLTLTRLAVRNEFCQEIMDLGGVKLMINTIRNNVGRQVSVSLLEKRSLI